MLQNENLISQESAMKALVANEVKSPNMPVDVAAQEAEVQYNMATNYHKQLLTAGITLDTINLLLIRANALREAEAQWQATCQLTQSDVKSWQDQVPVGYALRKDLSAAFRFAYSIDRRLLAKVREIGKGKSDADMIKDLQKFAAFGQANSEPLLASDFDMKKLDAATNLSGILDKLLLKIIADKKSQDILKDVRNRAFTIMKETLDYICDAGKYVFNDKPDISKLFTSDYLRNHPTGELSESTETEEELVIV